MRNAFDSLPETGGSVRWRVLGSCLACLLSCTAGTAQTLVENSPFLPPDFQEPGGTPDERPANPASNPTDLELQGIFEIAGEYRFNIFDRRASGGKWVGLNDPASGYEIVDYDRSNRSVQLRLGDRTVELTLKTPSDNPPQARAPRPAERAEPERTEGRRRIVVPPRRVVERPGSADSDENRRRVPPPPPPRSR